MRTLPAALAALVLATPAPAAEAPRYNQVNLSAEARQEVANDLMLATLFVELSDKDPTRLAAAVNRKLGEGVKLVHEYPRVKITTGSQSTWPLYDKRNAGDGWRTRAELRVESTDFEAAAKVIAQLQGNGMQMQGINFVVAPATADKAQDALIEEAIKAFNSRAAIAAKALGMRSWQVVNMNIATGQGGGRPMPVYAMKAAAMEMGDAVPAQEMSGGDTEIRVDVNGTVELVP